MLSENIQNHNEQEKLKNLKYLFLLPKAMPSQRKQSRSPFSDLLTEHIIVSSSHVDTIHDKSPQTARKYVDKVFWGQYLIASLEEATPFHLNNVVNEQ